MKYLVTPLVKACKLTLLLCLIHVSSIKAYSVSRRDSIPQKVYEKVDQAPNFPGGATGWLDFLKKNQRFPTAVLEGKVSGSVVITFIVDEAGTAHKPVVTDKPLGDFETMEEAMRLYKMMPKWIPATLGGKKISAYGRIEVPFRDGEVDVIVEEAPAPWYAPPHATNTIETFELVESMPTFPGGAAAMLHFIDKNLQYPAIAKTNGIHGMVVVEMIIEKDGSISNVKIIKGLGAGCSDEALRLVKSMPKWTPGTNRDGFPTRVRYSLPIRFKSE